MTPFPLFFSNVNQREIAAFEEENLSLRRELQEARASRSLAESHSSKCVHDNANITPPVILAPPSILSIGTPVRTTLPTSIDPSFIVACSSPLIPEEEEKEEDDDEEKEEEEVEVEEDWPKVTGEKLIGPPRNRRSQDEVVKNGPISEIPDVIDVGGKSPTSKDPRETTILTSRVLTAPSRATYTTAYI